MENRGLLFIPDISGFTRFVTESEIEHSRHIIQELLEILINSNNIGLEISEIEGDAILFYKFGAPPTLRDIYNQVEKMFCAFHTHLISYNQRRLCQCRACVSAVDLSLKVITHYGEFTGYTVKQFSKLIGKDIIVAHQLLKNDIEKHEYLLATNNVIGNKPEPAPEWISWNSSAKKTEQGEIPFVYSPLTALKSQIHVPPPPNIEPVPKVKVLTISREFDVDIKRLYYSALHFKFRHEWLEGVTGVDEVSHFLPGIGTRHRCLLEKGKSMVLYTSNFDYSPESKIIYSETEEKQSHCSYYILENLGENKSRLTIELYLKKNKIKEWMFNMFMKKKMEGEFSKSLDNLSELVKRVDVPDF